MNKKRLITAVIVLLAIVSTGAVVHYVVDGKPSKPSTQAVEQYTRLDIELKGGVLTTAAPIYLVKPGTKLEFHITSDKFGKVSVPTEPPQTITFTESPLVFHFTVSEKPGNYPLQYKANNSNAVITLGTITVKSN